jgi:hypothetical protein
MNMKSNDIVTSYAADYTINTYILQQSKDQIYASLIKEFKTWDPTVNKIIH